MHSRNPGWKRGDNWCVCQRCGFDTLASQTRKEWTGLIVCKECWESRHPQELLRVRPDRITPVGPVTGQGTDSYLTSYDCTTTTAMSGHAKAGCAVVGTSIEIEDDIPTSTFNLSPL